MQEISNFLHTETEKFWNYGFRSITHEYSIDFHFRWKLYLCKVCINVTLEQTKSNSDVFEKEEILLYPFKKIESDFIPKGVAAAYDAALKVRQIDGAICAIAIRRTLEMICIDKGAKGYNLFNKLKSLSDKGILPPIIEEMTDVLREIGNSAAHPGDEEFNQEIVPSMLEFIEVILDYVYNLPNQIKQIQGSIGKKNEKNDKN